MGINLLRRLLHDHWSLPMKEVFSNKKVVENHALNYAGTQILRTLFSSAAHSFRGISQSWPKTNLTMMLRKNGYILIPNFLSWETFQQVKDEFFHGTNNGSYSPIKDGDTRVERYTLSPYDWKMLPAVTKFLSDSLLIQTLEGAELKNIEIGDVWFDTIYYDDPQKVASSQNQLHSDTFHTTHKVWFFIEPVKLEDGPLCFVPGSNQLSLKRLMFEYKKSINFEDMLLSSTALTDYSFRVEPKDRTFLGCMEKVLTCPENTLVIANTRGFHRRGYAKAGHTRKQIHFCIRTNPFSFS
jgi:hypothetical protein